MSTQLLIKKFRPIFIFSKEEKHYPINKKFLNKKSIHERNIRLKDTENLICPEEPLYYHILKETEDQIAVAYILIFPYTKKGIFDILGERGDIVSAVAIITKSNKTLKGIYYWDGGNEIFDKIKTTRPVIFVSANDHLFSSIVNEENRGLRWEPEKCSNFKLEKLKNKKLEDKKFDIFLKKFKVT